MKKTLENNIFLKYHDHCSHTKYFTTSTYYDNNCRKQLVSLPKLVIINYDMCYLFQIVLDLKITNKRELEIFFKLNLPRTSIYLFLKAAADKTIYRTVGPLSQRKLPDHREIYRTRSVGPVPISLTGFVSRRIKVSILLLLQLRKTINVLMFTFRRMPGKMFSNL